MGPPSAQSPFATCRCYRHAEDVMRLLAEHYFHFIAPTGSCARPLPWQCLWLQVFAGCCQPLLRNGPSRRYLCRSFHTCLDPCSGGPQSAISRFFLQGVGLPHVPNGSAHHAAPTATSIGSRSRSCSHSLMFKPVCLLATPIAPTLVPLSAGRARLLHPRVSRFVTSPCSGYANRPNRATGGKGTCTPQDRQPCRLLPGRPTSSCSNAARSRPRHWPTSCRDW